MTYPFDLGTYSRTVTTDTTAQTWFDRGLVWLFGYNHEEAIACFKECLKSDPNVALAHWGIAYAIGPNYNKPWIVFTEAEKAPALALAHRALESARACAKPGVEADLVAALAHRYPADPGVEDFDPFNAAFADAMRPVYKAHPEDLEVSFAFAEALMNRTPWRLWDFWQGIINPEAATAEAQAVLETAFQRPAAWDHPGLLHMYIHLMEMSPHPEKALRHGDRLTGLVPDAGHLVHMATHIDVLCGDYQNVVARNYAAHLVDDRFKSYAGGANFYALYRIHNLHFETYGAMFMAQPTRALDAARRLRREVPDEVVRVYPELFEAFVASRPHVLVRFGMWEQILEETAPQDAQLYAFTIALIHYAKAVALANLGRDASAEVQAFMDARAAIPEDRMLFQNKAHEVLEIAHHMMLGEVAFKSGQRQEGLQHLRDAVWAEDHLNYEEPWAWPQPSRHALGALLMEAGEFAEAEQVYRADLGLDGSLPRPCQHPGNVWALHGLYECLTRRGETSEARHIKLDLDRAMARAEHPITASCYCRAGRPAGGS